VLQHFFIFPLRKKDEEYGGLLLKKKSNLDLSLRDLFKGQRNKKHKF
jgi:hypothetical protein